MQKNTLKTAVIIGASSGLGLATAKAFTQAGYTTIQGARSFNNTQIENAHFLHLDVTNAQSCMHFVAQSLQIAPHIDVFIYCAGTIVFGPCEEVSSMEYTKVLSTNFIGLTQIMGAFLPHLRKQSQAKVFLFSSVNGVVATPFQSAYVASKHAIEGYAKCLQMELSSTKVQVCVVRPGDHQSGSINYRNTYIAQESQSYYNKNFNTTVQKILKDEKTGSKPNQLAKKLVLLSNKDKIPSTIFIGKGIEKFALFLSKCLPTKVFYKIIKYYYF